MSALLVALLAGPAIAAVVVAVLSAHARTIAAGVAAVAGIGWALVASYGEPVATGELEVDALTAATAAGLAALVVASVATAGLAGTATGLLVLAALPAAAALGPGRLADRPLAGGIVVVAVLVVVRLFIERRPGLEAAATGLAGVVLAAGLIGDDPGQAVALAAAGTFLAVVATALWRGPARLLLPAALLALARAGAVRVPDDGADVGLLVVAGFVAVGAGVLVLVQDRPVAERLPLAAVLAAAGLLAVDVADLRAAGALLAGGAVLALAAQHPVALAALVPGAVAAAQAVGFADQPEHAVLGAAVLAALGVAIAGPRLAADDRPDVAVPLTVAAVVFAVVPMWGWSGADTGAHLDAVVVAVAAAVPVVLLAALARLAPAEEVASQAIGRLPGSMIGRPHRGPRHASATDLEPLAEGQPQEEAGTEAP